MIEIIYSENKPTIRNKDNKQQVFCIIRKRWLLLTPEEWVRQNFLMYLIEKKFYPASLIAVEKQIILNGLKKRFDIVVYDSFMNPLIIVECKEMNIQLTNQVLHQALAYYAVIQSSFLILTNGNYTFGFIKNENQFFSIDEIPDYKKPD